MIGYSVNKARYLIICFLLFILGVPSCLGQDTLGVMTYNVLDYGDYCQGTPAVMTTYLKTIVKYANPDLLGLVKMQAIKLNSSDVNGISSVGFADTILAGVLNADYPGKYAYCTLTNVSLSGEMVVLFYNKNKLGFIAVRTLCTFMEDFDFFKLYYKDPDLSTTHDTTFIYVLLNHTQSGNSSADRDQQDTTNLNAIRKMFYHLPNLIDMGDFNLHNTSEPGYEYAVAPADTNFRLYDPPFYPENTLHYPIDWDDNPSLCPPYLTTSTRQSGSIPNSCGTSGGAKDWYDHILLSPWIVNNTNYIKYIKGSYKTIGNDGKRVGISINDSTTHGKNTSASSNVINALFQFSNKYPVMLKLGITYNTTGQSPPDPNITTGIKDVLPTNELIKMSNPIKDNASIFFSADMTGQKAIITWYDLVGRLLSTEQYTIETNEVIRPVSFPPGMYFMHIQVADYIVSLRIVKE